MLIFGLQMIGICCTPVLLITECVVEIHVMNLNTYRTELINQIIPRRQECAT